MRSLLMLLVLSLPAGARERFYCNAKALTPAERERYVETSGKLFGAALEKTELKNGYSFRFTAKELAVAAEWIDFESRCCPFFTFDLQQTRDRGPLLLKITGSEGVKEFIRAELAH